MTVNFQSLDVMNLPADFAGLVGLQRLLFRSTEHFALLDYRQPERVNLIVVITSSMAVTFDNWIGTEFFETRARRY